MLGLLALQVERVDRGCEPVAALAAGLDVLDRALGGPEGPAVHDAGGRLAGRVGAGDEVGHGCGPPSPTPLGVKLVEKVRHGRPPRIRHPPELAARCGADGTRVLSGGCVPVSAGGLPFTPIMEVLRVLLAELGPGGVRELAGPSWPELAWLLPALGKPQTAGPPSQAAQARLFEVLLGLLGRLGEQAPLVLVLEDLHWADRSTRDLLAFLVRNLRREQVLLVASYRSDEPGQGRLGPYLAELDRGGPVQRLELQRFDRAETIAQLTAILGAVPSNDLVDAVFARSEGNPFFTEELLAAVRAGSGELPATVRDLLRGRVEALPEPARQVLAAD